MAGVVRRKGDAWKAAARAGRPVEMVHEMMTGHPGDHRPHHVLDGVTDDDVRRMAAAFGIVLGHISLRFATFWLPARIPLPAHAQADPGARRRSRARAVEEHRYLQRKRPDDLLA